MKNTITKLAVLLLITVYSTLFTAYAQVPQAFNYQAVARDASGNPIASHAVGIEIYIRQTSATGTVVYIETFTTTTNQFGLFTLQIGMGTQVVGTFNTINWSTGSYWLQVQMDPTGGTLYVDMGTTQLLSVPFAMYANNAGTSGATGPQGPTGNDGATGPQGPIGNNGIDGATGPQGIQGITGPTGSQGATGSSGAEGVTGLQGIQGIQGATGPTGNDGATGPMGVAGNNGINGVTGSQGIQGITGQTGATGAQGIQGITGPTGSQGTNGVTGATGAQGIQGSTGITGATGSNGTNGVTGTMGSQGIQGITGPTGAAGTNGTNGATGSTGVTGAIGAQGITGPTGTAGTNGSNGATGATGAQGIQGITGPTGLTGANGGTGATGSNGNDGAIGATGATGVQGIQGVTGPTGMIYIGTWNKVTSYNITDVVSYNGSSYYAINANGGEQPDKYTSDWGLIASGGATGAIGTTGATGATGATGNNGTAGVTGTTGADGTNGSNGATGVTGPTGATGSFPSGINPGDMQYWNGSAWIMVPVGQPGQYLQLSASSIPAWTGNTYPTLTSTAASSITSTTVSSGGNITSDGGATVTARGVCWSTSANPTLASGLYTSNGTGTGSFTSSISGLEALTTYYVRAYATNSLGTAYGNQVSFTTAAPIPPTLYTTAVSSITSTTASSGGNITSDGGATVTARGVCWSTSANPTIANSITNDGSGTGTFSSSITGLTINTTYYYVRAYATNSAGTAYGNSISFTTIPIGYSYEGGKVCYILQPADPGYDANIVHGLIAATSDQSTGTVWSNVSSTILNTTGTTIGTGNANTNAIMGQSGASSGAAFICHSYSGGGYTDWYLPSMSELNTLYLNKAAIGGFAIGYYWCSSEASNSTAYDQAFNGADGAWNTNSKSNTYYVRAIRSF